MVMAIGNEWYNPIVRANRELYCQRHGYHLMYVDKWSAPFKHWLTAHWAKVSEVLRVFDQQLPYDWIWLTDSDVFIMDVTKPIEDVIESAVERKRLNETNASREQILNRTDFVIARDGNILSTGSWLVRCTNYSMHIFREIWLYRYDKFSSNYVEWQENAVLVYLTRIMPELNDHIALSTQKEMNAFFNTSYESQAGHYQYEPGDFVVHFIAHNKDQIIDFLPNLVETQPELKTVCETTVEECKKKNCSFKIQLKRSI
jgi:hypothetical protein